jgi:hypothetical protein
MWHTVVGLENIIICILAAYFTDFKLKFAKSLLGLSNFPSIFLLFGLPNACASAAKRPAHLYCIERTPPQTMPVLSPFESEIDICNPTSNPTGQLLVLMGLRIQSAVTSIRAPRGIGLSQALCKVCCNLFDTKLRGVICYAILPTMV